MKMIIFTICVVGQLSICNEIVAQKYLPHFSVVEISKGINKISWNNPHKNCIQLAVQRSTDSLNNFRTILSAQSPELEKNGFIDKSAPTIQPIFYRIFYTLKGGSYFFSTTIRPCKEIRDNKDTNQSKSSTKKKKNRKHKSNQHNSEPSKKLNSNYFHFDNTGNLILKLPDVPTNNYQLKIYTTEKNILFSIDQINEKELIIEKVNFTKAGWYEYELISETKIVERKIFFISKY